MAVPRQNSIGKKIGGKAVRKAILCALIVGALAIPTPADEIRLKDGKKLYGVIVAYEDNMFKIKTDFGFVLVEKDKIASIVPTTPAATTSAKAEPKPAVKKEPVPESPKLTAEPATESSNEAMPTPSNVTAKSVIPTPITAGKSKKSAAKVATPAPARTTDSAATPAATTSIVDNSTKSPLPPASASAGAPEATASKATPAAPPAPPKEPEVPANREEIQGNYYTNYTHAFRMYKPPSWSLIEDARKALPNAIVAMGTSNESTLMVVGQEKTKEPLDVAAAGVEKRLHDVYDKYQGISQRKLSVGGLPAVEYHYRGVADDHAWSGTLVVVARGTDILTVLGMTYADTDLIQIQENVIARSIASLDFSSR